ncbi:hypothetical protein GJ496_008028 [Pomphorhynchus laevis]|nr:hypothetical protein GJ496_008028 [Pomphorhynchus laevis]
MNDLFHSLSDAFEKEIFIASRDAIQSFQDKFTLYALNSNDEAHRMYKDELEKFNNKNQTLQAENKELKELCEDINANLMAYKSLSSYQNKCISIARDRCLLKNVIMWWVMQNRMMSVQGALSAQMENNRDAKLKAHVIHLWRKALVSKCVNNIKYGNFSAISCRSRSSLFLNNELESAVVIANNRLSAAANPNSLWSSIESVGLDCMKETSYKAITKRSVTPPISNIPVAVRRRNDEMINRNRR